MRTQKDSESKTPVSLLDVKPNFDPLRSRKEQGLPALPKFVYDLGEQRKLLASKGLRQVRATSTTRDVNGRKITREWLTTEAIPRRLLIDEWFESQSASVQAEILARAQAAKARCVQCNSPQVPEGENSVTQREAQSLVNFYNFARVREAVPVTFNDVKRELMRGYKK